MVNIIKFEVRKNLTSLMVWLIVSVLISLVYLSVFPAFSDESANLAEFLKSYPKEALATLNINPDYITSMEGYYPMVIGFVQLIAFAFTASLTLKVFCLEYKNKSVEFLMAKPRSRSTFFNAKILSVLITSTIYFILISIINYLIILSMTSMSVKNYLILQLTVYIVMIIVTMLTSLFAIKFSKIRGYEGIAFIIAFAFYFINILSTILEESKLAYLSIYGIFDLNDLLINGYDYLTLAIITIILITLYVVGLISYTRKDVL